MKNVMNNNMNTAINTILENIGNNPEAMKALMAAPEVEEAAPQEEEEVLSYTEESSFTLGDILEDVTDAE